MADEYGIAALKRRVSRARDFPAGTCPASRHVHSIADALVSKRRKHPIEELWDAEHIASSLYAVLASLWEARKELTKLKNRPMSNRTNTKEKT